MMTFKKFFFILAGVPAALFLVLWAALWVVPEMEYMDGEYPYWIQQRDYLLRDSDKREVIFLGDSLMKAALMPSIVGDDTYNLSLPGATPIEMYYSLVEYLEHHPKPRAIFCGFNPEHYESAPRYKERTLYFHYLSERVEEEVEAEFFNREGFNEYEKKEMKEQRLLCDFRLPSVYAGAILQGGLLRGETNRNTYQDISENRGNLYKYSKEKISIAADPWTKRDKFRYSPTLDFYLRKLFALCQEKRIPIWLISLPMSQASHTAMKGKRLLSEYYEYVDSVASDYEVKNYVRIECYENDCFRDPWHLDSRGVELFSKSFKEKFYDRLPE